MDAAWMQPIVGQQRAWSGRKESEKLSPWIIWSDVIGQRPHRSTNQVTEKWNVVALSRGAKGLGDFTDEIWETIAAFWVCSTQSDYTTMPRSNNATCLRCSGNLSPSDQPPVLIDTSTQSNLLSNFCTRRLSKSNFCEILLVSNVVSRGM